MKTILAIGRRLAPAALSMLILAGIPTDVAAQQGRTALDARLDSLATERAQELSAARAEHEEAVKDLRSRAVSEDDPDIYTEGHPALERELELQRLMIELDYQTRRADILAAHIGRGPAADMADGEEAVDVEPTLPAPLASDEEAMSHLNDELARAWAEFHERAEALRERVREDDSWDGYEAAVSELEAEYAAQVARIEEEQRMLRMRMAREQAAPESDEE
jgi:hypothetical protein